MKSLKIDVAVIGGGAAGLLAASVVAERGLQVTMFEPNAYTGRKLGITGKGRCNVTNAVPAKEVMENVPTNGRFLFSALQQFSPADVQDMFQQLGVPLKIERGNRVFPESDRAADIVGALRRRLAASGAQVARTRVLDIRAADGHIAAVETEQGVYACRAALLCTGGMSYPLTGSTGDGYRMAAALGHTVVPPRPSLVPLCTAGKACSDMQGLALKNVRLTAYEENRLIFSDFGEMLFTHFGISGPLVLSASAHMRRFGSCTYRVEIDLKPALDEAALDRRVLSDFAGYQNTDFCNSLGRLLPRKLIPQVVAISGITPHKKCNSITREERRELVRLLKHFSLEITGPRPIDEAIVTAGGISVKEINPKTMESRLMPGLYFAGEIIDVDAYTGGFNLQIAWSTAHAAASNIELL